MEPLPHRTPATWFTDWLFNPIDGDATTHPLIHAVPMAAFPYVLLGGIVVAIAILRAVPWWRERRFRRKYGPRRAREGRRQ